MALHYKQGSQKGSSSSRELLALLGIHVRGVGLSGSPCGLQFWFRKLGLPLQDLLRQRSGHALGQTWWQDRLPGTHLVTWLCVGQTMSLVAENSAWLPAAVLHRPAPPQVLVLADVVQILRESPRSWSATVTRKVSLLFRAPMFKAPARVHSCLGVHPKAKARQA